MHKSTLVYLFSLLIFSGGCYAEETVFTPEGKVWRYEGSEATSMEMVFKKDGVLEFRNGFDWLSPAKWNYTPQQNELMIILEKATKEDLKNFTKEVSWKKNRPYAFPKKVNEVRREVVYTFPSKILFLGFVFEQQDLNISNKENN